MYTHVHCKAKENENIRKCNCPNLLRQNRGSNVEAEGSVSRQFKITLN